MDMDVQQGQGLAGPLFEGIKMLRQLLIWQEDLDAACTAVPQKLRWLWALPVGALVTLAAVTAVKQPWKRTQKERPPEE